MARLRTAAAVLVVALLGIAADAGAQTNEVAAFVGLGFGGSVASPVTGESVGIGSGLLFGGAVSTVLTGTWRIEGYFSRQDSRVEGSRPGTHIDLALERYLAGVQEEVPWGSRRAFGTLLIGATRFVPAGAEAETRFTLGLGLGVKARLAPRVGLRIEGHCFYTPTASDGALVCGPGGCIFAFSGYGVFQGDVTAGIYVGF
jgi:hypothetical protein